MHLFPPRRPEYDRFGKTAVIFSPDGSRVAFLTPGTGQDTQLVAAKTDGSDEQVIAEGPLLGSSIAWSADGQWIAAPLGGETGHGLYLVSPDGSDSRQVTRGGTFNDITWLDGMRLRFSTYQGGL